MKRCHALPEALLYRLQMSLYGAPNKTFILRLRAHHVFGCLLLLGAVQCIWLLSEWMLSGPISDVTMDEFMGHWWQEHEQKWEAKYPGGGRPVDRNPCHPKAKNATEFASLQSDPSALFVQMEGAWHWAWIQARIQQLWAEWLQAATELMNPSQEKPFKRKILLMPGFLTMTDFASPKVIGEGGPLGELVTWADLAAALTVLGHDIMVEYSVLKASHLLRWFLCECSGGCCESGFDFIYTDYSGLGSLPQDVLEGYRYKLRVLDWFGTDAQYNDGEYARRHGFRSDSAYSLYLQQFLTGYPVSSDNSFLGFAISASKLMNNTKGRLGVLYGKDARYAYGKEPYFELLSKHVKLHATMARSRYELPADIDNHGVLAPESFKQIAGKAKVYVGLGDPIEGPSPLEVLASATIFLNPKFPKDQQQLRRKPTDRQVSSQVPYLEEYVGPPHVFTFDIHNTSEVENVIKQALDAKVAPFIPYEFSLKGYLERLNYYVSYQDFCRPSPHPALRQALQVLHAPPGFSCMQQCKKQALLCEPSLFSAINSTDVFNNEGIKCHNWSYGDDMIYPAYDQGRHTCHLQTNPILFSCGAVASDLWRLCPCRDRKHFQIALCEHCT